MLEEERIAAFDKKITEREKLYPYADMTEAEFAEAHPKVHDFMKKDPNWDFETFQKVSFANPGETFQTTGARDIGLPLGRTDTENLDLFMTPFGVTNYEMRAGPMIPDKSIMSDYDKAAVLLHELRHKGILTDPKQVAAQPPGAVEDVRLRDIRLSGMMGKPESIKEPPVYRHLNPPGSKEKFSTPLGMHELYTRFLDRRYGAGPYTPSAPYFDKILRDEWEPYAKDYERIAKARKYGTPFAQGGLSNILNV